MSTYVQLGRVEAGLPPALVDDEVVPTESLVYVRRVVPGSASHVWQVLVSPLGTSLWLGHGAVIAGKGQPYVSDEATPVWSVVSTLWSSCGCPGTAIWIRRRAWSSST